MTSGRNTFLPYGRQCLDEDDIAAVAAVLRSDFLTTGPAVRAFEAALAEKLDAPYAVSCSSATAGLHLAMMAAGIGPGDAVMVPAVTFLATANAARFVGAEVIFSDVDPKTGLMRVEDFERALGANRATSVKCVVPVALAGQAPPLKDLQQLAADSGAILIEDSCHGLGTTYRVGNETMVLGACRHADMSVFSFHPVKALAMGEGGAVSTRSPELAEKLARFRGHGMTREPSQFLQSDLAFDQDGRANPWYYEMHEIGYNYRASDINCALGLSQLAKLVSFIAKRTELVSRYDQALKSLAPAVEPLGRVPDCSPGWHLYVALIDFDAIGMTRARFIERLAEKGIGSQVHYLPLNKQPYYRQRYGDQHLPGADGYYAKCLSLPLYPAMTERDVDRVAQALEEVVSRG